ncbi:6-bladed beta-propeller [Lacibacter sp. H375]|uniref:6-bladed beta-propeller n=1 Tax=Lacibacter sp. H375 TaxID=3133424 RepID=UPI0030BCE3FA
MRNFFFALFLLMTYVAGGQSPQTLYFDPASTIGAPASRIFESITYIPLETTKQSLFGQISRLVVTPQYFIIFDYDTQGLYFFDKSGKFIKKYKDDKYLIGSMQFFEKENALYILQSNKNFKPTQQFVDELVRNPFSQSNRKYARAVLYDLSDITKEQIKEIPEFTIYMANPYCLAPKQWAYSIILEDKDAKDSVDYELKVSDGNKAIRAYFPYAKRNSSYLSDVQNIDFFSTSNSNTLLFSRPYIYTIYQLTADSITPLYNFVLPFENTIPKSFFSKQFSSRNELREYKQMNPSYVWEINGLVPFNNYLFFSLDYQKRDRRFLFERNGNRFYNVNRITPDSSNAFLPIMGWNIQYYDNTALYSSISSDAMFRSKETEQNKKPVYSELVKTYFDKSKSSANPVIIILKPLTKTK